MDARMPEQFYEAVIELLPEQPERGVKIGHKFIANADEHVGRHIGGFRLLNPPPGSSVLEIGAGWLLALCRELRGCQVEGFDISWDRQVVPEFVRTVLAHMSARSVRPGVRSGRVAGSGAVRRLLEFGVRSTGSVINFPHATWGLSASHAAVKGNPTSRC